MKRFVLLLVILAGAMAVFFLRTPPSPSSVFAALLSVMPSSFSANVDAPAYRTAAVERGDIVETVQAAGTLNALVLVEVGSQISGQVKELSADFNSTVTQDQVIARVEPEIYEAKLEQAKAELEMAETMVSVQRAQIERDRAAVENAKADEEAAKAQTMRAEVALDNAKQDLERNRPLAEHNVISAGNWERIQNAYRSARADVTASQAQELSKAAAIRAAEAALGMSEAQLTNILAQVKQKEATLRQAQIDMDRTYIRAPVTGVVVNRAVSSGQTVAASLQTPVLFTIAQDLKQMQVEASIVEADVSRFKLGQAVTFTVDAYSGRLFTGSVKQIRKAPKTIQNIVTYVVVISAENPDELLLPGMTANLQVVVSRREGVLKVPNMGLRFRPAEQAEDGIKAEAATINTAQSATSGRVFVLSNGHLVPKTLRLGITDGRDTEVVAGDLKEGELIVVGKPSTQTASDRTFSFHLR
jgi:HlyD family secretion protein